MLRRSLQLLPLLLASAVIGCQRETGRAVAVQTTQPVVVEASAPKGAVRGRVNLTGWATSLPAKKVDCARHQHTIPDESVVASADGSLKNAVVFIKGLKTSSPPPSTPAVLDQVNCVYIPHVLALQTGQTLRVKSSDNTLHNVHTVADANRSINRGMMRPGSFDLTFSQPEIMKTKCDVHPWMSAYIAVFDHPYHAITTDNGTFEIKDVPAGQRTLVAWHEKFGILEQQLIVPADGSAEMSFTFRPPTE